MANRNGVVRVLVTMWATGWFMAAPTAWADCADGSSPEEVRQAFQQGQTLQQGGQAVQAVWQYLRAQAYVCGSGNPVAAQAAKLAAPLAKQLGAQQEQAGNLFGGNVAAFAEGQDSEPPGAYQWYVAGGYFSKADQVLLQALRHQPMDVGLFEQAQQDLAARSLPSFQSNYRDRLAVTGAYSLDPALYQEVKTIPAKNVERLLADEAKAFQEAYFRDYAALLAKRPTNPTDFTGLQQAQIAEQKFHTQWSYDPLHQSHDLLEAARQWSNKDSLQPETLEASIDQRALARGDYLAQNMTSVPAFLQAAIDYYYQGHADAKVESVQATAALLGDQALTAKRYQAAVDYYGVAGADDKASAASAKLEAERNEQAQIMAAPLQEQAERMKSEFSDPEKQKAMREQAEKLQKDMEKSPQQQEQFQKDQKALEDELGL